LEREPRTNLKPLKILYVADGQNPHAQGFISLFSDDGHEIHVASTYPVPPNQICAKSITLYPFDFSAKMRASEKSGGYMGGGKDSPLRRLKGTALWRSVASVRDRLASRRVPMLAQKLRQQIIELKPDIVHAFRLPYEGYIAAQACEGLDVPLLISTWGNDFTLYADTNPRLAAYTRTAMARADALHPDCMVDLLRAFAYGFDIARPSAVLPGNGGLRLDYFNPEAYSLSFLEEYGIDPNVPVIVNARGWRRYIRNDLFWESIPEVLEKHPDVCFVAVAMKGNAIAEAHAAKIGKPNNIKLLPPLPREKLAALFAASDIFVSLGEHDGTPNTLLEAIACGAYPLALDIPSLRETIRHGINGTLVTEVDSHALATAICEVLRSESALDIAREANLELVSHLSRDCVKPAAETLYGQVTKARLKFR